MTPPAHVVEAYRKAVGQFAGMAHEAEQIVAAVLSAATSTEGT